jgi:MipA family protein
LFAYLYDGDLTFLEQFMPRISKSVVHNAHFSASRSRANFGAVFVLALFAQQAGAQSSDKKDTSPWNVSVGALAVSTPEYEGAKKSATGLVPSVSLSYKTQGYGTFSLGGKGLGAAWTIIDKEDYSFGLSLGASQGRSDSKDGTAFRPGSKRLKGMGEIKSAGEFGVFGHVNAGVPIMLAVVRGSGDGKADAKDRSIRGHGGTRIELSTEIPWQISSDFSLSFSPNIVWADKKYNQTYFGVTSVQSANSGFKAYNAGAGVKSVGLAVGAEYKFTPNWSANAALALNQLQGDAAKSPLVQKKAQTTLAAGVNYKF